MTSKTTTKPQAGQSRSAGAEILSIERISFDLGNRFNAITDGQKMVSFPSYCSGLSSRQDLDFGGADFQTRQSFRVDIGAVAFKVGAIAGQLGGKPTFGGNKWLKVQPFLFAGLASLGIQRQTTIKELRCTVPDDQDVAQCTPFKRLTEQALNFKVNGNEYTVHIEQVKIAAEGKFAWYRALKDGF